jgi:hypothetical protein
MSRSATPHPKKRAYHDALVSLFVQYARLDDVVKAAAVSRATVVRWKAVPQWWAEVEAARGEVLQETLTCLRAKMPQLAEELSKIALDSTAPGAVRVRAIATVFEQFSGLTKVVTHEDRLTGIEERLRIGPSLGARRPTLLTPLTPQTAEG